MTNCKIEVFILDRKETFTLFLLVINEYSLVPEIRNSLNIIKIEGIKTSYIKRT